MSDTNWDELIDEVIDAELSLAEDHPITDDKAIVMRFDAARTDLRSAIDKLVDEIGNLKAVLHGNQDADYNKQLQIETLKEQLKAANEDAGRLAEELELEQNAGYSCEALRLHRARLAGKEGE